MTQTDTRLCLSNHATHARDVLARLPRHTLTNFGDVGELDGDLAGSVVVATAEETQQLLQRPGLQAVVIVFSVSPPARHGTELIAHAAVAGVLDATTNADAAFTLLRSAFTLAASTGGGGAARMLQQVLEI